ncbi:MULTISPECIES: hypothetical protein [unclassified Moorena]|nr:MULTISPECIES: hypothetical protein [unclassified Moorena]NEO12126.1 hypothetical protein [Moorena sp. SIO3E8]NEQ02425.1 hypothetical protein [Moorena sp. SIO3F7]
MIALHTLIDQRLKTVVVGYSRFPIPDSRFPIPYFLLVCGSKASLNPSPI